MNDNWKQSLISRYNKEKESWFAFNLITELDFDEFGLLKCLFDIKDNNPDYKNMVDEITISDAGQQKQ